MELPSYSLVAGPHRRAAAIGPGLVCRAKKRWRNQIAVFRQRLQRSAVLEERNRIAREIHDTVEQELAGITMQLDLAADCLSRPPTWQEKQWIPRVR